MSADLFAQVNDRLNKPEITPGTGMPDVPYDVRAFLGSLGLLRGVPIYYLIPNEHYLPKISVTENDSTVEQGSLKMFWLDKEWIECLIDGALSIGPDDDRIALLDKAMAGNYVAEVFYNDTKEQIKKQLAGIYTPEEFETELQKRLERKAIMLKEGQPEPTIAQNNWCYTGFLMRSSILSAWVGVEVVAQGRNPNIAEKQGGAKEGEAVVPKEEETAGEVQLESPVAADEENPDTTVKPGAAKEGEAAVREEEETAGEGHLESPVAATAAEENPVRPLQVVRLERLANDTLFCICEGIISQLVITQPTEGFHFGLNSDESGKYQVADTSVTFKSTPGVIDIKKLVNEFNKGKDAAAQIDNSAKYAHKMHSMPVKISIDVSWTDENKR